MAWLAGVPKPVGVFAANDQLGVRLLDARQRAGIAVPEEVALAGGFHRPGFKAGIEVKIGGPSSTAHRGVP